MMTQLVENLMQGAGMLFRHGVRLQAAAASCAQARFLKVGQGGSGKGANAVVRKPTSLVFSE